MDDVASRLRSEERADRKEALRVALERVELLADADEAAAAWAELHAHLLARWDDDVEACRGAAIEATGALALKAPPSDFVLSHLIAAAKRRLVGAPTPEPSEELRLRTTALLRDACVAYAEPPASVYLAPHYDDCVDCLSRALRDEFAEVKNAAAEAVIALARALPREFGTRSEALAEAIVPNLGHRHSKVRTLAAQAIGEIVLASNADRVQNLFSSVAMLFLDENSAVRLQVTKVVGKLMLEYRDKYSVWQYMIPLLFTGLCDAYEAVNAEARTLWERVGLQYINENEDILKSQIDFSSERPKHYPSASRPNLGCRTLIIKNMGKIISAILRELNDWQNDTKRLRCAQILCCIILHAENKNVLYAMDMIDCMLKGAQDEEQSVVTEIARAAELLGYFISPNVWWDLINTDVDSWNGVFVLANMIKGSDGETLHQKYPKRILKELTSPRLLDKREQKYQINLLHVCEALMDVCNVHCQTFSQDLFNIIFVIYATPTTEDIERRALCLIGKLRETIQYESNVEDLYCFFIRSLLVNITSDPAFWNISSLDRCILSAILVHTGPAVGLHLHLISPLLYEALSAVSITSPDVKLELFTSLCSLLLSRDERLRLAEPDKLSAFMNVILKDIIIPNLAWNVGKTAETLRTITVCCLCTILQDSESVSKNYGEVDFEKCVKPIDLFPDKDNLLELVDDLLPKLVSLVGDDSKNTRQYALKAIHCLVKLAKRNGCFKVDHLHRSYADIMSHLDDPNDKVRHSVIETLCTLFLERPEPYDIEVYNSHIDALYNTMLIHLDDPDTIFQENVLDALKKICVVHPKLLKGKMDAKGKLFKNQKALEHLDKHLESLTI